MNSKDERLEERRRFLRLCTGLALSTAGGLGTCAEPGPERCRRGNPIGAPCAACEYPEAAYYRALPED